ncbi:uncharacterized protein UBRO_20209 [Ustilago bromivora]|uniref:Uncharacterized protein n=1 Tax=Ustilago bromivora TaxID=307758 RepID=A0A1K0H4P7_9BASI|nr:uncharacterized protein UBRO_20209 [Ustilago bromivora]
MPPPRWAEHCTPPPPPPSRHLPTNSEIAGWSEQFVVADLVVHIVDGYFPCNWDVPVGSLPELRLHHLAMLCLTEGYMPWPSWQCCCCFNLDVPCFASSFANPFGECNQIPCACMHCYLAGLGHCEHDIPAHPGMEYTGNGTLNLQPQGSHQAEQAHLTMVDAYGPGLVLWHLPKHQLVGSILQVLQLFIECHDQLFSEHQPHKLVTESGGPPDRINTRVEPTVDEQWSRAALAAPVVPSSYVDI